MSNIAEGFALLATDGKAEMSRIGLPQLLQDVVYLHESSGVQLELPSGEVEVFADRTRLMRAFNNLVQNALESAPGRDVDVKVRLTCAGGQATVEVLDNGEGIEEARLERIFEPKFTTKTHGLGLGLAMVRAIVKGAEGCLDVSSELGKGSAFVVVLPQVCQTNG